MVWYRANSGRRTWYMAQGKQRSANVHAPSSAVQQAYREALARQQQLRGEYLVNIVCGRRTAQKRVTGGRWRRIVLGDVLAEHVSASKR